MLASASGAVARPCHQRPGLADRRARAGVAAHVRAGRAPPRGRAGRRGGPQDLPVLRDVGRCLPVRHRSAVRQLRRGRRWGSWPPGPRPPSRTPVAAAGLVMLLAVFAFKVSAVPFHSWAPDTYEGAPVPVAAYLSVVSKTAGFAGARPGRGHVLVLEPGLGAVRRRARRRHHARRERRGAAPEAARCGCWPGRRSPRPGYVLVPFGAAVAAGEQAEGMLDAVVAYLVAYAAMNLGAFAVVAVVARRQPRVTLADFDGLAWRSPWLGAVPGAVPGRAGRAAARTDRAVRQAAGPRRARRDLGVVAGGRDGRRHGDRPGVLPVVRGSAVPPAEG